MEITVGVLSLLTPALIAFFGFVASKRLDELRWDRKVQEQAARVAEYMALARRLEESSPAS